MMVFKNPGSRRWIAYNQGPQIRMMTKRPTRNCNTGTKLGTGAGFSFAGTFSEGSAVDSSSSRKSGTETKSGARGDVTPAAAPNGCHWLHWKISQINSVIPCTPSTTGPLVSPAKAIDAESVSTKLHHVR